MSVIEGRGSVKAKQIGDNYTNPDQMEQGNGGGGVRGGLPTQFPDD